MLASFVTVPHPAPRVSPAEPKSITWRKIAAWAGWVLAWCWAILGIGGGLSLMITRGPLPPDQRVVHTVLGSRCVPSHRYAVAEAFSPQTFRQHPSHRRIIVRCRWQNRLAYRKPRSLAITLTQRWWVRASLLVEALLSEGVRRIVEWRFLYLESTMWRAGKLPQLFDRISEF